MIFPLCQYYWFFFSISHSFPPLFSCLSLLTSTANSFLFVNVLSSFLSSPISFSMMLHAWKNSPNTSHIYNSQLIDVALQERWLSWDFYFHTDASAFFIFYTCRNSGRISTVQLAASVTIFTASHYSALGSALIRSLYLSLLEMNSLKTRVHQHKTCIGYPIETEQIRWVHTSILTPFFSKLSFTVRSPIFIVFTRPSHIAPCCKG